MSRLAIRTGRVILGLSGVMASAAIPAAQAQQASPGGGGGPVIATATGSPAELRTAEALADVLARWDVAPFVFTDRVIVDETAIPRSHPVPTLDTEHAEDPEALLALFLHEQLHHFDVPGMDYAAAAAELRRAYPDPPLAPPEGAVTRSGTYLHLLVCDLELAALSHLLGAEAARRVLAGKSVYRWIYRTVLEEDAVRVIADRHGLTIGWLLGTPSHDNTPVRPGHD